MSINTDTIRGPQGELMYRCLQCDALFENRVIVDGLCTTCRSKYQDRPRGGVVTTGALEERPLGPNEVRVSEVLPSLTTVVMNDTEALLKQRGSIYGPNPFNQETVAKAWTAILEAWFQMKLPGEIPPHLVANMMMVLKILRASTPFQFHQDNFDDIRGYCKIAEKCAKETDNGKEYIDDGFRNRIRQNPKETTPERGS